MAPKVALRIALMPTRKEGRREGLPEKEEKQVKSAQRALKRILAAKWSEWTRGFRSDAARFERSNGCKSDFGKLAARRTLKYIKLNLSACK